MTSYSWIFLYKLLLEDIMTLVGVIYYFTSGFQSVCLKRYFRDVARATDWKISLMFIIYRKLIKKIMYIGSNVYEHTLLFVVICIQLKSS